MFWELLATVFAGLGAAGIVLAIRALTRKKLPNWWIPVVAGCAMLGFQIYSEYTWFSHQKSLLPSDVQVVKTVPQSALWRPWSYFYPQTLRFIAMRVSDQAVNQKNPNVVLVDLYFFERRMSARHVPQVFHCTKHARAHLSDDLDIPASSNTQLSAQWMPLSEDDELLQAACSKALPLGKSMNQ